MPPKLVGFFQSLQGAIAPILYAYTLVMGYLGSMGTGFDLTLLLGAVAGAWNAFEALDLLISQVWDLSASCYVWFAAVRPLITFALGLALSVLSIVELLPAWDPQRFFPLIIFAMMTVNGLTPALVSEADVPVAVPAPPELPSPEEADPEKRPRCTVAWAAQWSAVDAKRRDTVDSKSSTVAPDMDSSPENLGIVPAPKEAW